MAQFILLLHESAALAESFTPEVMQTVIAKYNTWTGKLRQSGHFKQGQKLEDGTGRVMVNQGGRAVVTNGPYAESKEVIGGFILIEAADYDEAVELSRDCPHMEWGKIEIRQFDNVK